MFLPESMPRAGRSSGEDLRGDAGGQPPGPHQPGAAAQLLAPRTGETPTSTQSGWFWVSGSEDFEEFSLQTYFGGTPLHHV